jgi:chloramphenicol 3-O phosphotransferase
MMTDINWPDVILLNGSSSAGKSTIATLLQDTIVEASYLYFGFDTLVFLSPKRYWADAATPEQSKNNPFLKEGVHMVHREKEDGPVCIDAVFGPAFNPIISAMPAVVRTLVDQGNKVIFDHVFHDKRMVDQFNQQMDGINCFKVGVYCPLNILEQREKERGDRVLGRARGLYDVVHKYCDYDLKLDTANTSPNDSVSNILSVLQAK